MGRWLQIVVLTLAAAGAGTPAAAAASAPKKSAGAGSGGSKGASDVAAAGSVEFGLSGLAALDNGSSAAAYVDLRLGYFLQTGLEVGLTALEGTTRDGQRDTMGLFGEYDAVNSSRFIPFAGFAAEHAAAPVGGDGRDGKVGSAYGGVNLVVGQSAALAGTATWAFADHDVLGPEDHRERRDRTLTLGLRLFF